MRVASFDYELPPELVAQSPAPERELARMLVLCSDGLAAHGAISELPDRIAPGSLVVVNDTKVIPARILGTKEGSGGRAEIFLLSKIDERGDGGRSRPAERWRAMGRSSKPLRPGSKVVAGRLFVEIEDKTNDGLFSVLLSADGGATIDEALRESGRVPLPPYIRREALPEDAERYQTVFARVPGAVAAPTAGLHLTRSLMRRLEAAGCEIVACTLHVGLGTFQPVTTEDLDDHPMHAEAYEVSRDLSKAVARARERGRPVVAVGTTVVRALESARDAARPGYVLPSAGETRLLIQPGYRFSVVDRLLTNFHLPRSTLLALVCAFAGTDRVLDAYRRAVARRYRFFSYGDAMLLDRSSSAPVGT